MGASVFFIISSVKIDEYQEKLDSEELITHLFVISDNNRPIVAELYFYHPGTKKGALLYLPQNIGSLIDSIERVDALDAIFDKDDLSEYAKKIEEIADVRIDYTVHFTLESFSEMADILQGIPLFISHKIDIRTDEEMYILPAGSLNLDGAKIATYLTYYDGNEDRAEVASRFHEMTLSFIKKISSNNEMVLSKDIFPLVYERFETTLDEEAFKTFIDEFQNLKTDNMIFQRVLGVERLVGDRPLLFPFYDNSLLKETVIQVEDSLANYSVIGDEQIVVSIRIENGTTTTGLAGRTAQLFESYGYNVVSIDNADKDDYEHTIILDKRGNNEFAQRAAHLIKCERIHTAVDEEIAEVDLIIILGKDFDGRFIKK